MGLLIDVDFKLIDDIDNFKREEAIPATIDAVNELRQDIEVSYKPLDKQKQEFAEFVKNQDIMSTVFQVEEQNDIKIKKHNSIITRILKALNI
jgi:hypothetical protein